MGTWWILAGFTTLVFVGAPGAAQMPAREAPAKVVTDCDQARWPLDGERARLAKPGLPELESGARLPSGVDAVAMRLRPQAEVGFVLPPERPPARSDPLAGTLMVRIPRAGLWQVTMSDAAWVDVVENGRLVPASAFTGVHQCPGVRKSLRFNLEAGDVVLQLSDASARHLRIVLAPLD